MPDSGALLKVGLAAVALPLLNTFFLFWAHYNAYRRGHLAAGTILGVTLGPLGALIAEFLPKLGRSSAAILAQLDAREDARHGTWHTGLVLLYLGTTVGGGVGAWLLLQLPQSNWLAIAAVTALVLIVGGSSILTRGLPPERFVPPLADAGEYTDDAPDFAADLERAHEQHQLQHRAEVLRQAGAVCIGIAVLSGFGALIMLVSDGTLEQVPRIRLYGWVAAGGAMLAGLAAVLMKQRSSEALAELDLRAAENAVDYIDWHPAIPRELAREYVRGGQAAQEAYRRHIQLRLWAIGLTAACIVGGFKALLGVLFNVGPVVGNWSLLFLAPLAFAWLIFRWRSEAEARWFEFETNAWSALKASESINALLPPESREQIDPPPPKIDGSFEFAETIIRCAGYCFRLGMFSLFSDYKSVIPLWLGAWLLLHLIGSALSKRVEEDLIATGVIGPEALQPEGYMRKASASPLAAIAANVDPLQADAVSDSTQQTQPDYVHGVSREWLEYVEQSEQLEVMEKQHAHLLGQVRAIGVASAVLAYLGIATLVMTLQGLRTAPEPWENPEQLSSWPAIWLAGAAALLLLRGRIEDQIGGLPHQYIRETGHRNYAAARALSERLDRGLMLRRRLLWTGAFVLTTAALGNMLLTADGMLDVLKRSTAMLIVLELAAVTAIVFALAGMVSLRRRLAQSKSYSAGLAAQHFREQIATAVERQRKDQELTVEDHGHFMVEHQAGPPSEYIEQRIKRIVAGIMDRDPVRVALDLARSLCYTTAALLSIWDLVARPLNRDPNLPSAVVLPVLGLVTAGLVLGLMVRLRTQSAG